MVGAYWGGAVSDKAVSEAKARVAAAGASPADAAWFDGLGWRDAGVPAIANASDLADFQRREALLNRATAHLSFAERASAPDDRLAAALGARIADWRDRGRDDDAD